MIAHFALMGDLYQYDPYNTEASFWNSYPWQLGAENNLDVSASIPAFTMAKMIWSVDDSNSSIGTSNATVSSFGMSATLILMDNFGNLGSGVGDEPGNPDSPEYLTINNNYGDIVSVEFEAVIKNIDSNSEDLSDSFLTITNNTADIVGVVFTLSIKNIDSNSEDLSDSFLTITNNTADIIGVVFTLEE